MVTSNREGASPDLTPRSEPEVALMVEHVALLQFAASRQT